MKKGTDLNAIAARRSWVESEACLIKIVLELQKLYGEDLLKVEYGIVQTISDQASPFALTMLIVIYENDSGVSEHRFRYSTVDELVINIRANMSISFQI